MLFFFWKKLVEVPKNIPPPLPQYYAKKQSVKIEYFCYFYVKCNIFLWWTRSLKSRKPWNTSKSTGISCRAVMTCLCFPSFAVCHWLPSLSVLLLFPHHSRLKDSLSVHFIFRLHTLKSVGFVGAAAVLQWYHVWLDMTSPPPSHRLPVNHYLSFDAFSFFCLLITGQLWKTRVWYYSKNWKAVCRKMDRSILHSS